MTESSEVHNDPETFALKPSEGDSIAAAMIDAGILHFRRTDQGLQRGLFCGMGICGECRVHVPGRGVVRACITPAEDVKGVAAHCSSVMPDINPISRQAPLDLPNSPDVLIVGAGPAGLTAAECCALAGCSVVVLDERPKPGGQYYKQQTLSGRLRLARGQDKQAESGRKLIERARSAGAIIVNEAVVWAASDGPACHAMIAGSTRRFTPKNLVIATGAYERPHTFRGWTNPGVMTTGAIQTLLRTYGVLPGKRFVIAGNGPLNFQVATEILNSGGKIEAVIEAAPIFDVGRQLSLVKAARYAPSLVARGIGYVARLRRADVPILTNVSASSVKVRNGVLTLAVSDVHTGQVTRTLETDVVGLGHGFLPSTELSRMIGCEHETNPDGSLTAKRSSTMETTISNVYQIGDSGGIEGAFVAMAQGKIAATAITGTGSAKVAHSEQRRHRKFQKALWSAFQAIPATIQFADDETQICRCESVSFGKVRDMLSKGVTTTNVKRATRMGMGACQGRYCGWVLQQLIKEFGVKSEEAKTHWAPRPPVRPISLASLSAEAEDQS